MYRIFVVTAALTAAALPATAQQPAATRPEPACVTLPANAAIPETPLHIVGGHDSMYRTLLGPRDLLVIDGGTSRGVDLNQTFYVRRAPMRGISRPDPRGIATVATVHIVAVNEGMALATIDRVCDGIFVGDFLHPFDGPPPPEDRVNLDEGLDFDSPARMMFGPHERDMVGSGEFVVTDAGEARGIAPGARFAIYRDVQQPGVPLFAIGEATVVSVTAESSLVHVNSARTAVRRGDVFIPRK